MQKLGVVETVGELSKLLKKCDPNAKLIVKGNGTVNLCNNGDKVSIEVNLT